MRRLATPEDIALAVLFFASPASGYVTGAVLEVDGGPDGPNSRDCRALACEENGDRLTDAEQVTTRRRASTSDNARLPVRRCPESTPRRRIGHQSAP